MQNIKFLKTSLVSAAVLALLAGCASKLETKVNERIDQVRTKTSLATDPTLSEIVNEDTRGSAAYAQKQAEIQRNMPVSRRASKPWIASRTVAVQSDEMLPQAFYQNYKFNFENSVDADAGRVSIHVIAERLSRVTNIPVRVKGDVLTLPGATTGSAATAAPTAGAPVTGGANQSLTRNNSQNMTDPNSMRSLDMRWEGSLSGFLDHVSARMGTGWAYRDGAIVLERFQTETFEIAALQSSQSFTQSMSGSSSGTSGSTGASSNSSSGMDVSETGKIEALQSLGRTVLGIINSAPGSSVNLAEGSGSLVVTTTKDAMSRVREVLRHENAALLRTVQLQFDIYSVTVEDKDSVGIDWYGVFQSVTNKVGGTLATPSATVSGGGSISFSILPNQDADAFFRPGSQAVVSALAKFGNSVQHRPVSMTVMNRQWARKTNLRQTGYLAETSPSTGGVTGGGGGLPGLKTGTVTTGDTFAVQPAIMDNGTIVLKFGIGLTDLLGLFDVTSGLGASQQRVQTPEVAGTNDQATVPLRPGDALILTGMSRTRSSTERNSLGADVPVAAGGSRKASRYREEFIIVVRPVLM